jgi:hypothetical protein
LAEEIYGEMQTQYKQFMTVLNYAVSLVHVLREEREENELIKVEMEELRTEV